LTREAQTKRVNFLYGAGLCLFALAVLVSLIALFSRIVWPYPFETGEGISVYAAQHLEAGKDLYLSPERGALPIWMYPPLHTALLSLITSDANPFLPGRIVSFVSLMAIAFFVAMLVARLGGSWKVSVGAAACFLVLPESVGFGAAVRVDILAAALSLGCITAGLFSGASIRGLALAAALGCAAWMTKQTAVAAPLAIGVWLLAYNRKNALAFAGIYGFLMAACIGCMELATGRIFLESIVKNAVRPFSWALLYDYIRLYPLSFFPLHLIPIFGFVGMLLVLKKTAKKDSLVQIFGLCCLVNLVWLGKEGSCPLYFFEFNAACAVGFGLALIKIESLKGEYAAATAFLIVSLIGAAGIGHLADKAFIDLSAKTEKLFVKVLKIHRGPLMMEDLGFAIVAGRADAVDIPHPDLLKTLVAQGRLSPDRYVQRIQNQTYALIVLSSPAHSMEGLTRERYPGTIVDAVRDHYAFSGSLGERFFYKPPKEP